MRTIRVIGNLEPGGGQLSALRLGVSLLLAEYLLAGGVPGGPVAPAGAGGAGPFIVDVDSLLPGNVARPDLLVLAGPAVPGTPTVLLEAKGTHGVWRACQRTSEGDQPSLSDRWRCPQDRGGR